jgi:RND family efflux transporter MFP subunit
MKYYGLILVILVAVLAGCSAEAIEEEAPNLTYVETIEMRRDLVEKTYISIGEVIPENRIEVIGSGTVDIILKNVGDSVEKGEKVIVYDDDNDTTFDRTESQLRTIRENLSIQLEVAKENLTTQETLFNAGIASKSVYDRAINDVKNLENSYRDAVVNYNEQISALKETRSIESPISGTIAAIYVKQGQRISNQIAFTVIQKEMTYIKTFISGDLKHHLNMGDEVRIITEDGETISKIAKVNEIPDERSKLFELWVETDETFVIGDYVEIEYILTQYEATVVPMNAIVRENLSTFIYIVEENIAKKIPVEVGLTKGDWVEIVDYRQLTPVIFKGQVGLTDGTEVEVKY